MKKLIFNGSTLSGGEQYGVQRFAKELLRQLDGMLEPGMAEVVVSAGANLDLKNIRMVPCKFLQSKKTIQLWNQLGFPAYVKRERGYGIDLALTFSIFGSDVVAIHDCIIELFPENADSPWKKFARLFYIARVKSALRTSKFVITVSECAREDISRVYHYDKNKIFVIPNAWQHYERILPAPKVLDRYGLQKKGYFFALGSRYAHKNFKWIACAAQQNPDAVFVVCGSENLSTSDRDLSQSKPKNLIFTGYLQDGEVKALMANCLAYIQPSLYEGFGIPPMEAMSVGTDCIVSNVSSLPEIYGDSVWYLDPTNYDSIDLEEIMKQEKADADGILRKFSWEKSAEKLKNLLLEQLD